MKTYFHQHFQNYFHHTYEKKFRALNISTVNGLLIRRSAKQKNFLILELCVLFMHRPFSVCGVMLLLFFSSSLTRRWFCERKRRRSVRQQKQQFRTLSWCIARYIVSMLLSVVGCGRSSFICTSMGEKISENFLQFHSNVPFHIQSTNNHSISFCLRDEFRINDYCF